MKKTKIFFIFLILLILGGGIYLLAFFDKSQLINYFNQKDNTFLICEQTGLIALDNATFSNPSLFERANLLGAQSFSLTKLIKNLKQPLTTMAFDSQKADSLILSDGDTLRRLRLDGTEEQAFNLTHLDSPIVAAAINEENHQQVFIMTKEKKAYQVSILGEKIFTKEIALGNLISQNLTVEDLWSNPINKNLTLALTNGEDSFLIELSPQNWTEPLKQLVLPNVVIKGGFDASAYHKIVITQNFSLKVIDWQQDSYIASFIPHQGFKNSQILKSEIVDFGTLNNKIYLGLANKIYELNWHSLGSKIVLNRDIYIKNGYLFLDWKFSHSQKKPLFFASFNLKRQGEQTKIPTVNLGPLTTGSLRLPVTATFAQISKANFLASFKKTTLNELIKDSFHEIRLNLFAIDKKDGRFLAGEEFPVKLEDSKAKEEEESLEK